MASPSTTTGTAIDVLEPSKSSDSYLSHDNSVLSWVFTLDHKRIGVMYLVAVLASFALGGFFALALRTELLTPGETVMSAKYYNQAFTLHGAIMVFLVIIPGIPAALGNFVLPIQLGAKDVAFPRLNLASFHLWVIGALCLFLSLFLSAADTGWTFYVPYSTSTDTSVIPATFGAFILGFASIFTGLNFITTIHKLRPPGMTWFRMPLMLWALYSTAVIQVLATPVLGITLLLLIVERAVGIGIFDPALGGDPVLFQHFFWFYSHPAVYIMIVPAFGVISEIIPVFSRKPLYGYKFIALSSVAIAILGFLVWGHHMFTSSQSILAGTIFSAITFLIAIPTAIKIFNWIATMYKGTIHLEAPMLYALAFLWVFTIGGLTGIFLGVMNVDIHLHDTYFVVAHFHYVMMGGSMTAFLGGLYFWWPKISGKMYDERGALWGAILVFVGLNITFFPQFILGTRGMPRRYYNYLPEFTTLHQVSTIGAYMLGLGFLIAAVVLIQSLLSTRNKAPANPWGANTLEWQVASPPPYYNFHRTPVVPEGDEGEPYYFEHLTFDPAIGGYVKQKREAEAAVG